jgi:hypothetical protein
MDSPVRVIGMQRLPQGDVSLEAEARVSRRTHSGASTADSALLGERTDGPAGRTG